MLKKTLSMLLALVMVIGIIPVYASAQETEELTIEWEADVSAAPAATNGMSKDALEEAVELFPVEGFENKAVFDHQYEEKEPNHNTIGEANMVYHDYTVWGTTSGTDTDLYAFEVTVQSDVSIISLASAKGLVYLLYDINDLDNPITVSVDVGYDAETETWVDGIVITLEPGLYIFAMGDLDQRSLSYFFYTTITPHAHEWDAGTVITPATCTVPGVMTYSCKSYGCAHTQTAEIPVTHTWDAGVVTVPATVTAPGIKVCTCTVCGVVQNVEIPKLNNPFTDVAPGAYYYDAVLWALANNVTNGVTATTFGPDGTCTRGQVVTFLWRASGSPEPASTNNPFTDVPSNEYYYKAVLWAVEKGITNGTSATTFGPNDPCTRGHVVTFLHRSEGKPVPAAAASFSDVPVGQFYTDAVAWAVQEGITNGTGETTFSPNAPCTRGQIVTFLYRAKS